MAAATEFEPETSRVEPGLLGPLLRTNGFDLAFNMLNVGAVPLPGAEEPFWQLLDVFPASGLSGVELDPKLCDELNSEAHARVRYYPAAIGKTAEKRPLYETAHPMCSSLYPPDERYADLYGTLDVMRLKTTSEITTVSLDEFARANALEPVDFIKIDVQGAELEIFEGGVEAMRNVLFIVCEVEFVPLYRGQPLFGDIDACLRKRGMMLQKFLGMAGRVMKPLTRQGSPEFPAQFMWTDAVFVRDLLDLAPLADEQLLKLAVLLDIYDSKDAALHVLRRYDAAQGDDLGDIYLNQLTARGPWGRLGEA